MKSVILSLVLFYSAGSLAQVYEDQPIRIKAFCASDEIAFIRSQAEYHSFSSSFIITAFCKPAACVAVDDASTGKITIFRTLQTEPGLKGILNQASNAEFKNAHKYRSEVLMENVMGGKEGATFEVNKMLKDKICQSTRYVQTNKLIQIINSL